MLVKFKSSCIYIYIENDVYMEVGRITEGLKSSGKQMGV